jgi:hypothetical protein
MRLTESSASWQRGRLTTQPHSLALYRTRYSLLFERCHVRVDHRLTFVFVQLKLHGNLSFTAAVDLGGFSSEQLNASLAAHANFSKITTWRWDGQYVHP